jgi:hypothetical protein
MVNLSAAMAPTFVERVNEIVNTVTRLGPNPLRGKAVAAKLASALVEEEGVKRS